jgi:cellulose synthase/poly-beta-1,6-N-acetylglucosamine synthase-like glycosyltransferase
VIGELVVFLYFMFSFLLLPFGYNCLLLAYGASRYRAPEEKPLKRYPAVTVQLPVYNEGPIVEGLIGAVCAFRWPMDRLEVQVLDDSTDETRGIVDSAVEWYRAKGFNIRAVRREGRTGYKAGALRNAFRQSSGKYVAVFDADFLPGPDFLERTIPHLEAERGVGFVQARWGHLNRGLNKFTQAFAVALDAHHMVDQAGRYTLGFLMSFNGSAGVFRASAIRGAGGWSGDTMSEDMDLAVRVQLAGYRGVYLRDVVVPGVLPTDLSAFRVQQARWAKGSMQCARKLLGRVYGSPRMSLFQKFQATMQLTNYSISLLMFMTALMGVMLLSYDAVFLTGLLPGTLFGRVIADPRFGVMFTVCTLCTGVYYYTALNMQGISFRSKLPYIGLLALVGHGMSAVCAVNIIEGVFQKGGVFERVPKYDVKGRLVSLGRRSYGSLKRFSGIEAVLGILCAMGLFFAILHDTLPYAGFLAVYTLAYFSVSYWLGGI